MARRPLSSFPLPPRSHPRPHPLWGYWRFMGQLNRATLREIWRNSKRHRLPQRAAEMAYGILVGLLAGLLAILSTGGLIEAWRSPLQDWGLRGVALLPAAMHPPLTPLIQSAIQNPSRAIGCVSLLGALWAASGGVGVAMHTLDHIHGIPRHDTRPFWRARLVALALTATTALLLTLALGLILVGSAGGRPDPAPSLWQGAIALLGRLLSGGLALGLTTTAFALVYRLGPSRWTPRQPFIPGAVLAAVAVAGPGLLLPLYRLPFQNSPWSYGVLGAAVLLLLWLQGGALVLLLGDQTNVIVGQRLAQRQRPPGSQPRVPPPAFDSFTIRRSPRGGDRPWN